MVAISLYRGNLHRVSDIPRRWLMPNHTISLKDFKSLTRKREKTLSRLLSATNTTATATTSNPNPNSNTEQQQKQHEFLGDNGSSKQKTIEPSPQTEKRGDISEIKIETVDDKERDPSTLQQHQIRGDIKDLSGGLNGETQREGIRDSISCLDNKSAVPIPAPPEIGGNGVGIAVKEEKQLNLVGTPVEIRNDVNLSDREKEKKDVEENLKVLNEKKHNLVKMLKQILNAEEEIKRRNSLQASVVCPIVPQQMEAANDIGSNPKQAGNRMGPEINFSGDLEGESEDISNHNTPGRQFHRMRSTSPSASSPLRKRAHSPLQHTAVPQSGQPGLGVSGHTQHTPPMLTGVASSPSRFAPAGHQGNPTSLPPLSVSGIHCTASSPSPAASGGTSVFRDVHLISPSWN